MRFTQEQIRELITNNPVASMRAICAIFRYQTDVEKGCKTTINKNGVGFRANHAKAGTELAMWMTRNNFDGNMRRRTGGTTIYAGREVSRVWLACEIASWYVEQLTTIANGKGVNARLFQGNPNEVHELARVTCEEYYSDLGYAEFKPIHRSRHLRGL